MNAYELADLIDSEDTLWMEGRLGDICNMLRQQADRIAELEKQLTFQPNQTLACPSYLSNLKPQIKELSDEEILELADKHLIIETEYIGMGDYVDTVKGEIKFARAILKKANEK